MLNIVILYNIYVQIICVQSGVESLLQLQDILSSRLQFSIIIIQGIADSGIVFRFLQIKEVFSWLIS